MQGISILMIDCYLPYSFSLHILQKRDLSIVDSVSLLTQLCELCWQKIDEFNQFFEQVENIQASYNRQFLTDDGCFMTFEDSSQYCVEVDKIHNEFASKIFNNQIDDKKLYIEPFCMINVDENMVKTLNESSQRANVFDEKPTEIKQEHVPIEESGEMLSSADVLNTDSTGVLSDCEDDISYVFEVENDDDEDDDGDDGDDDDTDGNTSSDDYSEVREKRRKAAGRSSIPKRSSMSGKGRSKKSKKFNKKISVTTVNVLDEDNKRLLSYVQMKCDMCADDREFDSFSEIQNHFLDTHKQNGYIMCCNRKFRRIGRVLQHCTWHDNPEAFKCDTCNKCFQDNVCLRDHITSMHIPVDERRFQCEQCSRLFAKQHLLNTHLKMKHTVKEERPFVCNEGQCGQRFVLPAYLRLHVEKVHNKSDSR